MDLDAASELPAPTTPEAGIQLDFGPFLQCQGIVHIYAKGSDSVLDVGMAEQDLHGLQVHRRLVDE